MHHYIEENPATADKLRRASPHWMRHTHVTQALQRGVELTTSIYLHIDEARRARQLGEAFGKVRR